MESKPKTNFTLRLSQELREKLEQKAKQERRTLANLITKILEDAVEENPDD